MILMSFQNKVGQGNPCLFHRLNKQKQNKNLAVRTLISNATKSSKEFFSFLFFEKRKYTNEFFPKLYITAEHLYEMIGKINSAIFSFSIPVFFYP